MTNSNNSTNLVTSKNQIYLGYKMLLMIDKINYLISIEQIMSMFVYENETIETNVFSFLLKESQLHYQIVDY